MVTSTERILNAIELNDPIDKIPKMELFASLLPTMKFLINYHWMPKRMQNGMTTLITETVNTIREKLRMKKPEPHVQSRFGRILRKVPLIETIARNTFEDMGRNKSEAEIKKADDGTVLMSAFGMRLPIKLGYDMFSIILLQSTDIFLGLEKAPDGNYYMLTNEGAFYDLNPDDLEILPKGVKDTNILTKIEASKRYFQDIDVERWANLFERTINWRMGPNRIKDFILPTILTTGIFETWLTTFGNFNMQGFFRHVMVEWRKGCNGPYFELLKVKAKMICRLIKRLSEIDEYKVHIIGDDCAEINGPFLPPKFYKEYIAVHTKKIVDEAHKHGIKILFHTDGNFKLEATEDPEKQWEYMNILIDTGIDAFHPLEMRAMDIQEVKENFGDKLCLCNGIDTIELQNGTRKSVARITKTILEKVYRGGGSRINGYISGSDNSLHGGVRLHLVKQMLHTVDEYSKKILKKL